MVLEGGIYAKNISVWEREKKRGMKAFLSTSLSYGEYKSSYQQAALLNEANIFNLL